MTEANEESLLTWLHELIKNNTLDVESLEEWAYEFVCWRQDVSGEFAHIKAEEDAKCEADIAKIDELKPLVAGYKHDKSLPELPSKPNGSVYGIGFIYDEDHDTRVLVAIDQVKENHNIVAMAEHEGQLDIYTRAPTGITGMNVCGDEWYVRELVPYHGKWQVLNLDFTEYCISQVLGV